MSRIQTHIYTHKHTRITEAVLFVKANRTKQTKNQTKTQTKNPKTPQSQKQEPKSISLEWLNYTKSTPRNPYNFKGKI